MAHAHHTRRLARTEEALTVLFCLIDDAYALLNPAGRRYESLKRLSDSEVIALALFQQLRGVESERSFLRDAEERFFSHLFPGVASSLLVQPAREEAAALPGASAARRAERAGGGSRNADRRLDPARGAASAPGSSVGRLGRGGVG
jgi:hypothetical protein